MYDTHGFGGWRAILLAAPLNNLKRKRSSHQKIILIHIMIIITIDAIYLWELMKAMCRGDCALLKVNKHLRC